MSKASKHTKRFIISGGGTGGHIFPAIAIANALKSSLTDVDILFVGATGKMEMEKVPKAGYPIKGLWISGLQRKLTLGNLLFPIKLIVSMLKAGSIIRSFKPDAVIGVGGYASGPMLKVASGKGIPTLIQEQNSYAGITNKWLSAKVKTICVAYDGMEKFFPANKIVFTGNPIRSEVTDIINSRDEGIDHFGLSQKKKTVLLVGGSLGARTLNQSMDAMKDMIESNSDIQFIWQTGKYGYEQYSKSDTAKLDNVIVTEFIYRMDLAYAVADVVISRAGALAISELCTIGKPTILVPSPNVAEDHQTKNAMNLVEKDAAIMVKDKDAVEFLIPKVIKLVEEEKKQEELRANILKLGVTDAAFKIVEEIKKIIKE